MGSQELARRWGHRAAPPLGLGSLGAAPTQPGQGLGRSPKGVHPRAPKPLEASAVEETMWTMTASERAWQLRARAAVLVLRPSGARAMIRELRIRRSLKVAAGGGHTTGPSWTSSAAVAATIVALAAEPRTGTGSSAVVDAAAEMSERLGRTRPGAVGSAMASRAAVVGRPTAASSWRPRLSKAQRGALGATAGRKPATG